MANKWLGQLNARIKALPKEAILKQAGEALAHWLRANDIAPQVLEERMLAGEPILVQALSSAPADDVAKVRQWVTPLVNQITPQDYPKVLQALADDPVCAPHAHLLYYQYYYSHFVPAMEQAKRWMVTPETGTPPDA